jgi:rhamnulokinase
MSNPRRGYLAFDCGAESVRAEVGTLEAGQVRLHEVHRFNHEPAYLPSGMHWDTTGIWLGVLEGLRQAVRWAGDNNVELVSAGVDTWGVDYALLGRSGEVLGLPHNHRDPRHDQAYRRALDAVGGSRIYEATGIQLMPINTLYQLLALQADEPGLLQAADQLLLMPDLLHYFLTGEKQIELTNASTTQMLTPDRGTWAGELLDELDLPTHFLSDPVPPGTRIGPLRQQVREQTGASSQLQVRAPATHDTACAVAAIPADANTNWAYLSSGTWSLIGTTLSEPHVTEAACEASYTHERGVEGFRFLKNIAGLWLVQESRRHFADQGQVYDYSELTRLASEAEPFRTLIEPNHAPFLSPGRMPEKIAEFARTTGQPEPADVGACVRCCLESLALKYRQAIDVLEKVLGVSFDVLHVVGGGGKNELLNQFTANALQRPVIVGPHEATALGNVMTQALGAGEVANQDEIRQIVAASVETQRYTPKDHDAWRAQYERFESLGQYISA